MQTRWAHVRITNSTTESIRRYGKLTGDFVETWTLLCDCGYVWKIDTRVFPGRDKLPSCGQPDCKYSYPNGKPPIGRPRSKDPGTIFTLWLPYRTLKLIENYTQLRAIPKGRAAAELIDLGIGVAAVEVLKLTTPPPRKHPGLKTHTLNPRLRRELVSNTDPVKNS